MPRFRVIIEGTNIQTDDGSVGFFTVRSASAMTQAIAEAQAISVLAKEWARGESAALSRRKPKLHVVDTWRSNAIDRFRRVPNTGHSLYNNSGRPWAARLEAKVARAPQNAAIWAIAADAEDGA